MIFSTISFLLIAFFLPPLAPAGQPEAAPVESTALAMNDEAAQLAQARVVETVKRDYKRAFELYTALAGKSADPETLESAGLGKARCLVKLGEYADAAEQLLVMQKCDLSESGKKAVLNLLATTQRLSGGNRSGAASSVDNLVWQLLDAAAGESEERAALAVKEIEGMGALASPVVKEAALHREYFRSVAAFSILCRIDDSEVKEFLHSCAGSNDPALRKRCLDGLAGSKKPTPGAFGMLLRYFDDEEKALRHAALRFFDAKYSYVHGKVEGGLAPYVERIRAFAAGPDADPKEAAFQCALHIVTSEYREPKGDKAVEKLDSVARAKLGSYWPLRKGTDGTYVGLRDAIWITTMLGERYERQDLLREVARFWPIRKGANNRRTPNNEPDSCLMTATRLLDAGSLEEVVGELLKGGDEFGIFKFGYCASFDAFSRLSDETQQRFMAAWGRSSVNYARSLLRPNDSIQYSISRWRPATWAVLVESLLRNEDVNFRRDTLDDIRDCPDPRDPACFDAICRWIAHEDGRTRSHGYQLVGKMIENGQLDMGIMGGLGMINRGLATIEGPLQVAISRSAQPVITPAFAGEHIRFWCNLLRNGNELNALGEWLLGQSIPGWHDAVMELGNSLVPLDQIIRSDRSFVERIWPKLGARGKELLFTRVFYCFGKSFRSTKPEWLVPLLLDLEFSAKWEHSGRGNLASALYYLDEPALDPLVVDVVTAVLDAPESLAKGALGRVIELMGKRAHESPMVFDLVPLLFQKVNVREINNYNFSLAGLAWRSSETLRRSLEWLAGKHPLSFKNKVVGAFDSSRQSPSHVLRHLARMKSLGFSESLRAAWPGMGNEIRASLVQNLCFHRAPVHACSSFFVSLLEDGTTDPAIRHLAAATCLVYAVNDSVEAVLAYLEEIEPGQGDIALKGGGETAAVLADMTSDHLRTLFQDRNFQSGFCQFGWTQRQRLCLGLLSMPTEHPGLRNEAARLMRVSSESELAVALDALGKSLKPEGRGILFKNALSFMLSSSNPGEANHQQAIDLLTRALDGKESGGMADDCEPMAVELVEKYRLASLLPLVGKVAVHHSSVKQRRGAVACLGIFMDRQAVPFLMECLKDSDPEVRKEAQGHLERIHWYEEQKRVWQAFLADPDGVGGHESPAAALVAMLDSDDAEVRLLTIKSLGKLGEPAALPVLLKIVDEGQPEEREAAKAAVEAICAKR